MMGRIKDGYMKAPPGFRAKMRRRRGITLTTPKTIKEIMAERDKTEKAVK